MYPIFDHNTRAKILMRPLERGKLNGGPDGELSRGGGGGGGFPEVPGGSSGVGSGAGLEELWVTAGGTRELHGVTLNFTFTDMESIEARIKDTGIHEKAGDGVIFLLAVHVVPFPCRVLSVWIYFGWHRSIRNGGGTGRL